MENEKISCGICFRKLKSGEGRYNTLNQSICTQCYYPSVFLEIAQESELISNRNIQGFPGSETK